VHSKGLKELESFEHAAIGVTKSGKISFLASLPPSIYSRFDEKVKSGGLSFDSTSVGDWFGEEIAERLSGVDLDDVTVESLGDKIIIPGFVDTHLHAPQYAFTGTGYDLPLLPWLNTYTFPAESRCQQAAYAHKIYTKCVKRALMNGTTLVQYFGTIHLEANQLLAALCAKYGQRAYIGKVNMDRNAPDYYVETTESSIKDTYAFIESFDGKLDPTKNLVIPCITPRFVPTCTGELLQKLGEIAKEFSLPVQSHVSENRDEVAWVKDLFPQCSTYTQVYDYFGLLHEKTTLAHGVYLEQESVDLLKERNGTVSHCANSNFSLASGACTVNRLLSAGVRVSLGTDVSGGYSISILNAIRAADWAAKVVSANAHHPFYEPLNPPPAESVVSAWPKLTTSEEFYLATQGGADCLGLGSVVGNFLPGKEFDASIVDPYVENGPFDVFPEDSFSDIFSKFLFLGDDRNFNSVFVRGRKVYPFSDE